MISLQEQINEAQQRALVGTEQAVLLDEENPRMPGCLNGRTDGYRAITVAGEGLRIGELVRTRVTGSRGHWLHAELLQD